MVFVSEAIEVDGTTYTVTNETEALMARLQLKLIEKLEMLRLK